MYAIQFHTETVRRCLSMKSYHIKAAAVATAHAFSARKILRAAGRTVGDGGTAACRV